MKPILINAKTLKENKIIKLKDAKGLLEYVINNIKEPKCTAL